jgi:hypothetical protein
MINKGKTNRIESVREKKTQVTSFLISSIKQGVYKIPVGKL